MHLTYRHTRIACFVGYITQAIINNLSPLLFLIFQREFSISLAQISLIITINFLIQMSVDLLAARFVDKIGYRVSIVGAHVLATAGIVSLCVLPRLFDPYAGLLTATALSAIGGGLLEVLVSPMVEALPGDHKESEMSLLHSFYCWGHVGVVLLSTGFFLLFGQERWQLLPLFWALIPFLNVFVLMKVPLCTLDENQPSMPMKRLIRTPVFWLLFLLMICSGASEQAMSQWASFFAESGLKVSKTLGDLLGPCAFAILMGSSRMLFSRAKKLSLRQALIGSGILCVCSYLITILSPWPLLSLVGCGICGFSVGVMWPGVFSTASQRLPAGGTPMFALLALAGDIGCCSGPSLVGAVSNGVMEKGSSFLPSLLSNGSLSQAALKTGFLLAILFPLILIGGMLILRKKGRKE